MGLVDRGGFKDIENRSRRTQYRGPVLIHAGLNRRLFHPQVWARVAERHRIVLPEEMDFGGVVEMVDLVDCVTARASPWFGGQRIRLRPGQSALAAVPTLQGQPGTFPAGIWRDVNPGFSSGGAS